MKRILVFGLGVVLIGVGIVGLFLPVLQGWAMIFMGLALISPRLARKIRGRLFRKLFKKDRLTISDWKKSGVSAGFTTKHFPLVLRRTDDLLQQDNQTKLAVLLPCKKFALLNQIHGDGVAVLDQPEKYIQDGFYHFPGCDAALTNIPDLTLLALTADCLSIFLSAGTWIGVVHAGWRGSRKKIAPKMLNLIGEKSGARAGEVKVIFGPSIGAKHYEVGPEFKGYFPASSLFEKNGKQFFDLAKENERQLLEAGALSKNISDFGICTFEEKEDFYSFRREKENAGRHICFISKS
jgi:YfiH family protein